MLFRFLCGFAGLLLLQNVGSAQQDVAHTVYYHTLEEGNAVQEIVGTTTESPAGIKVQPSGKPNATMIPIQDVVRIEYRALPGVSNAALSEADLVERRDSAEEAHAFYKSELAKLKPDADPQTRDYFAYREAIWAVRLLNQKPAATFQTEAPAMIAKLRETAQKARTSWEFWPLYREAIRLALELGNIQQADDIAGELARVKGLTPEAETEVKLMQVALELRSPNRNNAGTLLQTLNQGGNLPTAVAVTDRFKVLQAIVEIQLPPSGMPVTAADLANQAPAIANLQATIAAATDPTAKAYGYNNLGDLYQAAGQPREAMWNYLWVDMVYNQNRIERVYAVHQLIDVFTAMKLKKRADQFAKKLAEVR